MMGQETFQISGNIGEREISSEPEINDDDINTVAEQANVSKEDAIKALDESKGDLAAAILSFKE